MALRSRKPSRREAMLGFYGPLSLLGCCRAGPWGSSSRSRCCRSRRARRAGTTPEQFGTAALHERRDVLHARLRRRDADDGRGPRCWPCSRPGWASASSERSSATCPRCTGRSRSARSRSRCWTRAPARRRRPLSSCAAGPRRRRAPGRPAARVGALGGAAAGDPHLVSAARLLPLAAQQPVVARARSRRSSTPPRCCWPARAAARVAGPAHVRHGPPRAGRHDADLRAALLARRGDRLTPESWSGCARSSRRRRHASCQDRRTSKPARRATAQVRALRAGARRVAAVRVAAVGPRTTRRDNWQGGPWDKQLAAQPARSIGATITSDHF